MDAQKHAVGFYEKFGFKVTSEDFGKRVLFITLWN